MSSFETQHGIWWLLSLILSWKISCAGLESYSRKQKKLNLGVSGSVKITDHYLTTDGITIQLCYKDFKECQGDAEIFGEGGCHYWSS